MRKVAYKRCSTNEDKQDVARQLFGMEFDKVFIEYASGKNEESRPVFKEMKEYLKAGDELYFNDLSRAGRNTAQLLSTVEELIEKGVKLTFKSESLTFVSGEVDPMAGAISKMLLTMLASVNELFLTQTKVAVKQGLERVRKESPEKLAKGINSQWRKSFDANRAAGLHKQPERYAKERDAQAPLVNRLQQMMSDSNNSLTQAEMAHRLNKEGFLGSRGKPLSQNGVSHLIKKYELKKGNNKR